GSYMPYMNALLLRIHHRKHAVVRSDKVIPVARRNNRPPRRSYPRIDHHHVHGPSREVGIRLRDRNRAIEHIKGLHRVRDIDNRRFRHDIQNDALYSAHKMIVGSKISSESDDRTMRQLIPRWKTELSLYPRS